MDKNHVAENDRIKFNTIDLFKWCSEVAEAMEYLASRKVRSDLKIMIGKIAVFCINYFLSYLDCSCKPISPKCSVERTLFM